MCKALDARSGTPIVILAESQRRIEEELRGWGREGRLVCPGCRTEVEVHNGKINRPHFAHWHVDNCPLDEIPGHVEEAKALLHEWLKPKYGSDLTYEYRAPAADPLPRPVDLYADTGKGGLAFWVVGKAMNPSDRELVQDALESVAEEVRYVFTGRVLHERKPAKRSTSGADPSGAASGSETPGGEEVSYWGARGDLQQLAPDEEVARLNLSTTERAFRRHSRYDPAYQKVRYDPFMEERLERCKSLSYLRGVHNVR